MDSQPITLTERVLSTLTSVILVCDILIAVIVVIATVIIGLDFLFLDHDLYTIITRLIPIHGIPLLAIIYVWSQRDHKGG